MADHGCALVAAEQAQGGRVGVDHANSPQQADGVIGTLEQLAEVGAFAAQGGLVDLAAGDIDFHAQHLARKTVAPQGIVARVDPALGAVGAADQPVLGRRHVAAVPYIGNEFAKLLAVPRVGYHAGQAAAQRFARRHAKQGFTALVPVANGAIAVATVHGDVGRQFHRRNETVQKFQRGQAGAIGFIAGHPDIVIFSHG